MELEVRVWDIRVGRNEATLNEEDARHLGIHPRERVTLFAGRKRQVAIVNTTKSVVEKGIVALPRDVADECGLKDGDVVSLKPAEKPRSVEFIRKKMEKQALNEGEYEAIVRDVLAGNLSEIEITAFVSALYINDMTMEETGYLTKAIAENGERLKLEGKPVFDKHSLGGVPGNKITLLIVPIVAAAGLTIPKTSSRAITSASGTADTMEVLAPVTFNAQEIEGIVDKTGGIICWGGGVNLAPADDIFIRVEHPLAIDPHNLAICSVMAKKYAVGADYVVIDLPLGPETKVRTMEEAKKYARDFIALGEKLGIKVECAVTYGDKPIGRAIGPALEAREALQALEGTAPSSLTEKSCEIAGIILEAGGVARKGEGKGRAYDILQSGEALDKMREIIKAQGGDPSVTSEKIVVGPHRATITSPGSGYAVGMSNKDLVTIARAAGAPRDKGAGILLTLSMGKKVKKGDPVFEIYAESEYKLEQAVKLANQLQPIELEGMLLERIPEYRVVE
ncbi:MAG: AMP phosphorylase [Euryarchaeota archaeon]|nr:AMP phosphorylase [Euryarchaeota archaeon]